MCLCASPRAPRRYNSSAMAAPLSTQSLCEDFMSPVVCMYVCVSVCVLCVFCVCVRVCRVDEHWSDAIWTCKLPWRLELNYQTCLRHSLSCLQQTNTPREKPKGNARYVASSCSALASGACGYFPFILCVLFSPSLFILPLLFFLFFFGVVLHCCCCTVILCVKK